VVERPPPPPVNNVHTDRSGGSDVIAFGLCAGPSGSYENIASPAIGRVRESDSEVVALFEQTSICAAYNSLLERFSGRPDLEALVLLHDDLELRAPDFCARIREIFADPSIGVIGAVGARDVRTLRWWDGRVRGHVKETRGAVARGHGLTDVQALDGLLLVLSPWAVRNVRFDAVRFPSFHGYDVDYCFAVGAAGRRVVVDHFDLVHHTKATLGDQHAFELADAAFRAKWNRHPTVADAARLRVRRVHQRLSRSAFRARRP
jgi:hypothetical protein